MDIMRANMEVNAEARYSGFANRKLRVDKTSLRGRGNRRSAVSCREAEVTAKMVSSIGRMLDIEDSHGQARSLVKDGVWQVPASERPRGWEKMGIAEI